MIFLHDLRPLRQRKSYLAVPIEVKQDPKANNIDKSFSLTLWASFQPIRMFSCLVARIIPILTGFFSDTITSHDKKRLYLDCLENYVVYIHQQMRFAGIDPVPIERVSSGRGLVSRSIRVSILVGTKKYLVLIFTKS